MGCTGPTPRNVEIDAARSERAKELEPPARPKLTADPQEPSPALKDLEVYARELASEKALTRTQAANELRRAGLPGVDAALRAIAGGLPAVAAANLHFLATLDFEALPAETQGRMRKASAAALKSAHGEVRIAAAQFLAEYGAGTERTDFLTAITDVERKVRWAVVRYYSEHPRELESAQLLVVVSYLGDANLGSEVRSDAYALLLSLQRQLSQGQKPESYDPYASPDDQRPAIAAWESWAKSR